MSSTIATTLSADLSKQEVADKITALLVQQGLQVTDQDLDRPWGGFFMIDETQIDEFIDHYFPGDRGRINDGGKLSPKILIAIAGILYGFSVLQHASLLTALFP